MRKCTECGKEAHFNKGSDVCRACEAPERTNALDKRLAERKAARAKVVATKKKVAKKKTARKAAKKTLVKSKKLTKIGGPALEKRRTKNRNAMTKVRKENPGPERARNKKAAVKRRATAVELEVATRTLCRRKLLPFIQKFNKNYEAGWVHQDICRRLEKFVEDVEAQKSPRLMLFMPPRHGKSEIASKNLPAWVLGKFPEWEIIAASYAVSLPIGFSRKVQATFQDKYFQALFPNARMNPKMSAAEAWQTMHEGGYVAAGVGGGITGKGAHILIIDDPVKDAQEADSDTQRETVWDWWGSTAKTRLSPGGGVLVIQTRWHDDDLSGRLISQMKDLTKEFDELKRDAKHRMSQAVKNSPEYKDAAKDHAMYVKETGEIDNWDVVKYPAIATEDEYLTSHGAIVNEPTFNTRKLRSKGDPLHAERYPLSRLRNMKRTLQPRHWSALYQQNPVPDEGMYFTKDMMRFTAAIPPIDELYLFSAWDLAVGEKQHNDYTVGVVGGYDWQGLIHIIDMVRFRGDMDKIASAVMSTYKKYPTMMEIGLERGQLELSLMPTLKRLMRKYKLYPTMNHTLVPISDKLVRARPLQGRMQQGLIMLPQGVLWTETVMHEFLRFPGGTHDDIVDAMAWMVRMAEDYKEPPKPGARKRSHDKSLADKLRAVAREQRGLGSGAMGA